MRLDVPVHLVSEIAAFPSSPFIDDSHKQLGPCRISHDGSWAWIVRNSVLEIFSCLKGERKSYWSFRTDSKNQPVFITAVTEFYNNSATPQLVIALDGINLLCLFDVNSSAIIRAVQLPQPIESIEIVASRGGACIQTRPLSLELRYMFGIVAVALEGGSLFLVDLCLDEPFGYTTESQPGKPFFATSTMVNLGQKREVALNNFQHMTFALNQEHFHRGNFLYRFPDGELMTAFNSSTVSITSMKYIPHLTILVVGFSFGGFQLWNLQKLLLDYSSSIEEDSDPIVKFAFQEPENDPRNYCYLWAVRGQAIDDVINPNVMTVATLYSLVYQKKEWIEHYGFIYQGLQGCVHRLNYPLTSEPLDIQGSSFGSRVISFHCIQQGEIINLPRSDLEELQGDDFANQDLSLCVLVWEAWTPTTEPSYFLALFDINQWYQAQMPSSIRLPKNELCSYFGIFSLLEVQEKIKSSNLLDVHIYPSSFVKYKSLNGSDEMYFPSSLAFKATCASECGIINVSYLGTQRQVLYEMNRLGPNCLIMPNELYNLCVKSSLLPISAEVSSNIILKREALLTLALNYNLYKFITLCIFQWTSVDYSKSGLTLKFLLNWIWKRVTIIKNSSDKICMSLFNYSGQELDQSSLALLHSYATQLERLSSILKVMHSQTGPITEMGIQELQTRQEVTQLIATFLRVILWLSYCSLLPEHAEGEAYGENEVAYPASTLLNTYSQRRKDLQLLHSSVRQTDLLLIDGMISQFGDLPLQWEKGNNNRLYPPPSLYAILGIYLVKGPSLEDKHCLMLYLLLDMAAFLSDKQSHLEEKLMQFPAAFKISHSRVKLTQGFWMLDHRDFEEAILFFTDPVISPSDILPWQHVRILKSFLYQGDHQKALKYIQMCKVSLHTPEEIKIYLTVLLANKLIVEAFQYQRQCCDERNTEDLLTHFFLGCQQTGNMDALLQLPFSPSEEEALIHFLFNSREPYHKDLLVMYFLQRGQPLEAGHVNDKIKPLLMDSDTHNKERTIIRSSLVTGFLNTLPAMQSTLAAEVGKYHLKMTSNFTNDPCPAPLSTKIHRKTVNIVTLSSRLHDLMMRVKDTWPGNAVVETSPLRTRKHEQSVWRSEGLPFVETPGTQRKPKKLETEVIFATPVTLSKRKMTPDFIDSAKVPSKKMRGLDLFSPYSRGDSERSKSMRPLNPEVLSLLQTPPVKRVIPALKARTLEIIKADLTETPPSILKVRQLIRRSATPPSILNVSRALNYSGLQQKYLEDDNEGIIIGDEEDDREKSLRFDLPGRRQGSVTGSEWSTTPEKSSEPEMDTQCTPTEPSQGMVRSKLNISSRSFNASGASPGAFSLHNSDEIEDEDEEITINYSIQMRRDPSVLIKKGGVSFLMPEAPKVPFIAVASQKDLSVGNIRSSHVPHTIIEESVSSSIEIAKENSSPIKDIHSPTIAEISEKALPLTATPRPSLPRSPSYELAITKSSISNISTNAELDISEDELQLSNSESETEEMNEAKEHALAATPVVEIQETLSQPSLESDVDEGIEPVINEEAPLLALERKPITESEIPPLSNYNSPSRFLSTSIQIIDSNADAENLPSTSKLLTYSQSRLNESNGNVESPVFESSKSVTFTDVDVITLHEIDVPTSKSIERIVETEIGDANIISFSSDKNEKESTQKEEIKPLSSPEKVDLSLSNSNTLVDVIKTSISESSSASLKDEIKKREEHIMTQSLEAAKSRLLQAFEAAQAIGMDSKIGKHLNKIKSLSSLESSAEETPSLTRQPRSLRSHRRENKDEEEKSSLETDILYNLKESSYQRQTKKEVAPKETKPRKTSQSKSDESDSSLTLRSSKVVTKGIFKKPTKKGGNLERAVSISPTISESSGSVFVTPEKQTSPDGLRTRSRGYSDSSPTPVPKELFSRIRKEGKVKSATSEPAVIEKSFQKRTGRRNKITSDSIPVILEDSVVETQTSISSKQTTALPFVFSPPSTRSRTRRKKSDSFMEQASLYEAQTGQDESVVETATAKSKKPSLLPPWECFINVISPPTEIKSDKTSRASIPSSLSSRHGMQLRTGPFKTRKKVKL